MPCGFKYLYDCVNLVIKNIIDIPNFAEKPVTYLIQLFIIYLVIKFQCHAIAA